MAVSTCFSSHFGQLISFLSFSFFRLTIKLQLWDFIFLPGLKSSVVLISNARIILDKESIPECSIQRECNPSGRLKHLRWSSKRPSSEKRRKRKSEIENPPRIQCRLTNKWGLNLFCKSNAEWWNEAKHVLVFFVNWCHLFPFFASLPLPSFFMAWTEPHLWPRSLILNSLTRFSARWRKRQIHSLLHMEDIIKGKHSLIHTSDNWKGVFCRSRSNPIN